MAGQPPNEVACRLGIERGIVARASSNAHCSHSRRGMWVSFGSAAVSHRGVNGPHVAADSPVKAVGMFVAISISPSGRPLGGADPSTSGSDGGVSEVVAEIVGVIRASGLPSETNAMFTNLEGEWDG